MNSSTAATGATTDAIRNVKTWITTIGDVLSTNATSSTSAVNVTLATESSTLVDTTDTTLTTEILTSSQEWTTKVIEGVSSSTTLGPYYEYSSAQFEVLLPCIFGVFVVLALSFIVFYSKHSNQYEVLEKPPSDRHDKPAPGDRTHHDWSMSNGAGEMNGAFSFG